MNQKTTPWSHNYNYPLVRIHTKSDIDKYTHLELEKEVKNKKGNLESVIMRMEPWTSLAET